MIQKAPQGYARVLLLATATDQRQPGLDPNRPPRPSLAKESRRLMVHQLEAIEPGLRLEKNSEHPAGRH